MFGVYINRFRGTIDGESIDVTFVALRCIGFELSVVKIKGEFPAESRCKANDLTRYKVDTASHVLPYIEYK